MAMTDRVNAHCGKLLEANINDPQRRSDLNRCVLRSIIFVFLVFVTLFMYLFQSPSLGRTCYIKSNNTFTHLSHSNYPFHPSIWVMGMFNQHTPQSLCDYKKTTLANQMFWNELLFDEQVWVIDANQESIRRAQTIYQYIYPYPKFYISNSSVDVLNRMGRIHSHFHMRTAQYELQQWSTFYFDIYAANIANMYSIVQPQILAIVDADSQLQTFSTFESVFPEMTLYDLISSNSSINRKNKHFKLRAFGVGRDLFFHATELLLGKPQIADFMVTFPVYVYLDTLKNMRSHVEKLHNMSFDDAFEKSVSSSTTYYSQFAIILSYAYWFERDRYSFYIQPWTGTENKPYSDLVRTSVPQPRVSLHMKTNPQQAIMKGCCFSYQLNDTIMNAALYHVFTNVNRTKIRNLCNSFDGYENQYEATCEYLQYPNDADMHIWKQNDTMTKHYRSVIRDVQYLSAESRNKKIMACVNYLSDSNPDSWFPHSDACSLI